MNFLRTSDLIGDFRKNEVIVDLDPIQFLISGMLHDLLMARFNELAAQ